MFEFKSLEDQKNMTAEQFAKYQADFQNYVKSEQVKTAEAIAKAVTKTEVEKLTSEILELKDTALKNLETALKAQGKELKKLQGNPIATVEGFKKELKSVFDAEIDSIKSLKRDSEVVFELKATQTYGDIDSGLDYAQMRPGVIDSPVRRAGIIRSLFSVIPLSTELYKYTEQENRYT